MEERVAGQPERLGDEGEQVVAELLALLYVVFKGLAEAGEEAFLWPLHTTAVFSYSSWHTCEARHTSDGPHSLLYTGSPSFQLSS